jgi:signal transduction histidine kinase
VKQIIPDESVERLLTSVLQSSESALAEAASTAIELTGRHKAGGDFPIEVMLSPLRGAEGALVTMAIRDVTTRKQAETRLLETVEDLNRSNQELGQFAYLVSHDLQEPLRTLEQSTFLQAHACDEAQGYYFSRPVPAEQFEHLLRTGIQ